ncbi:MAG: hypothetical protein Q9214_004401 [Letrouitia sp. 1 TL-2023]
MSSKQSPSSKDTCPEYHRIQSYSQTCKMTKRLVRQESLTLFTVPHIFLTRQDRIHCLQSPLNLLSLSPSSLYLATLILSRQKLDEERLYLAQAGLGRPGPLKPEIYAKEYVEAKNRFDNLNDPKRTFEMRKVQARGALEEAFQGDQRKQKVIEVLIIEERGERNWRKVRFIDADARDVQGIHAGRFPRFMMRSDVSAKKEDIGHMR